MSDERAGGEDPWLVKKRPEFVPMTPESLALFRLGEQCNNDCPMCSNSGRKAAFFIETQELLQRVDRLAGLGCRRVVLTGGEPTIHPGFWKVVAELRERGIRWDINSHGRTFSDDTFAARARDEGLERAIISLHSHDVSVSCAISGVKPKAHFETLAGIRNLVHAGAFVMINFVVTRLNVGEPARFLNACVEAFGPSIEVKFAFPTTSGKGGGWDGIQLRYAAVQTPLAEARTHARKLGIKVHFESVPNCILGDASARNLGRSGFGETHYLEDISGQSLFSIRHIEAALSAYPASCAGCTAWESCPGVGRDYLKAHGGEEFRRFH
jgi:MoaA/NifB/PqqE/SkfB family radical SAM enzyme